MRELTVKQFQTRHRDYDMAVASTPDIDHFCSSSAWILSAHEAFLPDHYLFLRESSNGFVALARGHDLHLGSYIHPLEASWALACPLVGPNVAELTREFVAECRRPELNWNLLFLSGISPNSLQFRELVRGFRRDYSMGLGSSARRRVASLKDGLEGFYSRRSPKFRANLRRARRRGDDARIGYDYIAKIQPGLECQQLFERALAVERLSWKGQSETGIIDGPMKTFYNAMLPRLAAKDALRFAFVTLDGVDIAYCFGAIFGKSFRGLQMSYHDDYHDHSPGSLAQLEVIRRLCEEGIDAYDLGSDMEYKRNWAEDGLETVALIVRQ